MNLICRLLGISGLVVSIMLARGQGFELENGKFSQSLDQPVRCGKISRIVVTTVPVSILDMDVLLLAGKFDPNEPYQQALTSRAPKAGNAFVFISFEVAAGLSIGRYDYVLKVGEQEVPMEALAPAGEPFDPRVWEIQAAAVPKDVEAFFEIVLPPQPTRALLIPQLDTAIKMETVDLPLGRKTLPTAPDPAPLESPRKTESDVKPEPPPEAAEAPVAEKEPEPEPAKKSEAKPVKPPVGKAPGKKGGGKKKTDKLEDIW